MTSALFLIIALFISCSGTPKGVLSEKQMVEVITDLNLAEGTMMISGIAWTDKQKKERYYNYVFEKHNITPEQFDTSFTWYARTPAKLEKIYTKVTANLNQKEADLEK
ncbi:hypothetical protein FACS189434_10270 [Bacteroidia bacterium]|nr:hypothetical protein FACS189434_10270 [Bacteroidia bacterium]